MGKWAQYGRRFCPNWEREDLLKHWIRRVPGDDYHAFCIYCKCEIRAHHSDLVGHMKSAKHRRNTPVGYEILIDSVSDSNAASSTTPRSRQQFSKTKVDVVTYDVFVGNLPKDVDEIKLERIYSKFGIVHNTWFNNCNTGSRFGIVKFYNESDALKAVEETNGWILEGNKLVVNLTSKGESAIKKEVDVNDNTEQTAPLAKKKKSASSNGGSFQDAQSPGPSYKAQEDDFKTWSKKAQDLSKVVKNLRIQFPLDKESVIDSAIDLIQSPSKIDSKSVPSLKDTTSTCVSCYKTIQARIMQSIDKNNLKSDIQARDSLKSQLLSKLADTNKELDHLPLQKRHKKIQDVLNLLTKQFDTYIKQTIPQPLQNDTLIACFEDWKAKKKDELFHVRKNSDRLESSVNTALELLKLSVSINPESVEEEFEDNLSRLFKNYVTALEQEVSKMKIENSSEATLIASLVQFLTAELKEEFNYLDSLCKTQQEFTAFHQQLKMWMNNIPSLTQLKAVKNKLKNLKSKLRHKLADKLDAEENHDMVSVVVVAKELEDIRSLIQKTLEEEDNFLAEFSELIINHFPELMTDEFAEDFNTFSTYKGVVKLSHSPEHYTMISMGNSGWFTSHFKGEPVLIKEYFLGSANKLSKAEFLSQLGMFSKVSSLLIEPIQAIFFDKEYRHAYMRIEKHGMLLSDKTNIDSLSKQLCQSVVKSLALALQDLHQSNLTHGQLHPDFIILDEEGRVTVMPPDFSMSLTDRCKNKYVTKSGLEIIPPEMKQNKIKGSFHAVDIYCLGLIALWLNHPNAQFFNDSGAINITLLSVDPSLYIFLKAALNPNPVMRPSIEKCLMFKYLSTTLP